MFSPLHFLSLNPISFENFEHMACSSPKTKILSMWLPHLLKQQEEIHQNFNISDLNILFFLDFMILMLN